jgi:hypothetical protein
MYLKIQFIFSFTVKIVTILDKLIKKYLKNETYIISFSRR